jgi:hypothetical protein
LAQIPIEILKYKEELAAKMGLPSPYGMGLMKELAADLVASGMVPAHFANNPMAVYLAAMRGREMGLDPMESILETFWAAPGKRLAMYAAKMLDIMHRQGVTSEFLREDAEECQILFQPPAPHKSYTAKFNVSEAKEAGLLKDDSNWKKWRSDMCKARAIARGWRALAGTFQGSANLYAKEELEDVEDSAAAEPSESDRKRAEVIAARDDMKVSLKTKPEPETIIVEAEKPAEAPEPGTNPEPQQAGPKPVAGELKYAIHKVFQTEDNGERVLPTEELPQKRESDAKLRAQAMANETDSAYDIVEINTATGEVRTTARCNPPKPIKQAEKPTEKPKAEPSKPKAAKSPSDAKADAKAALIFRLTPLAAALGLPGKTAGSRFNAFFAGLFGCKLTELPKETSAYDVAVEELEACVNGDINEFQASPEEAGARRARWAKETRNYLDGQYPKNPETVQLGVTLARRWRLSPTDFKGWFESSVIGLDFIPQADSHAFMRVMLATPTHRSGSELLRWFRKAGLPNGTLARAVEQIEQRGLKCSLESAHEDAVDRAVKAWLMAAKEQAPETVQEPTEAQPKEEEGGLFDDLV